MNDFVEMKNDEMMDTNGGVSVFFIAAGIIAVAAGVNTCYDLGKNLGEAIYYATH
ncbi:class IIb bacteriocin, lactobin A/cerein 7B family [Anaeromicropila populeti]|uniref:Class IIb bacteriocin, lactobin A/cerein 7B family n=1 Tax=Anaeromicropila populeti TaxID=37658 RepID=A0A1I6JPT0_9FIRM|nr:class IIb bacteriocin, lactobin A/cerein 7B family [Anaeromicropila populeti]SFR80982.1 class IIb bacteriocin, lactobin A/cerein 7B family [Anaeromicropila populeti]